MMKNSFIMAIVAVFSMVMPAMAKEKPAAKTRVALDTTQGRIIIALNREKAPKTTANFLAYVKAKFYDGTIFHRIIADFMIQGGGFTSDMKQKVTQAAIENEADNGLVNERYTIAMARTGDPHSATAQFFINTVNNDFLNFKSKDQQGWGYAVFGKVIEGMDVVDKIAKAKTTTRGRFQDVPIDTVIINQASIME
jgi:peptidyl-prolyl cis-trans isomerase B (cyclophilin B)